MKKLKILVVDDHPIYRNGLRDVLIGEKMVSLVEVASDGNEALEQLGLQEFDLLLLDLQMPGLDGVETAKIVVKKFPRVAIIILTSFSIRKQINELLGIGIDGYLLKGADRGEIVEAITSVLEGDRYLTHEVNKIYNDYLNEQSEHALFTMVSNILTKREVEVIKQICIQPNTKAIAQKLFVSQATINNHRYNIFKKLGVKSSIGLVSWAVQKGYYNPNKDNL